MTTKEGDHGRATYLMRTGQLPGAAGIQYPSIGSLVSKELGDAKAELPNFVSIAPHRFFSQAAFGPGFLGPLHAPLVVGENQNFNNPQGNGVDQILKVADLDRPKAIDEATGAARLDLLRDMQDDFAAARPGQIAKSHAAAYDRAIRLMQSDGGEGVRPDDEKAALRDTYGRNLFGQGCLLARRLVERGVPFVEVTLGNWDTHGQNFDQVKNLCGTLDPAWAALMDDLKDRGLLDTTLIVWMGEFGRTPKINQQKGRDHCPNAWSTVLAGGGIKGGQAVGKTSKDGTTVEDRPATAPDLLATRLHGAGHRPREAEPVERRPADPHRGQAVQADQGGRGVTPHTNSLAPAAKGSERAAGRVGLAPLTRRRSAATSLDRGGVRRGLSP